VGVPAVVEMGAASSSAEAGVCAASSSSTLPITASSMVADDPVSAAAEEHTAVLQVPNLHSLERPIADKSEEVTVLVRVRSKLSTACSKILSGSCSFCARRRQQKRRNSQLGGRCSSATRCPRKGTHSAGL